MFVQVGSVSDVKQVSKGKYTFIVRDLLYKLLMSMLKRILERPGVKEKESDSRRTLLVLWICEGREDYSVGSKDTL